MAFLETKNANIYYEKLETEGDGPWVTLINGHMRPSRDFRMLRGQLVNLGLKVLVFDNRDSGQSTSSAEYSLEDMCDDVISIWNVENIPQSHVLGISMGGLISMGVSLKVPNRISTMALISTFADPKWMLKEAPDWGADVADNVAVLKNYVSEDFYSKNERLIELMAEQTTKEIKSGKFLGRAKRQRSASKNYSVSGENLARLKGPVLVVHGEQDQIVSPESAKELKEFLPNGHLHLVPQAGHLLLAECSGELLDAYKNFLSQHVELAVPE